jgi:branched-chain amino acid transport system ATP-binding protein
MKTQTSPHREGDSTPSAALQVRHLIIRYGSTSVLHDISLYVGSGEVVALIGANGAGKSTTLRAISGLVPPVSGEIRFRGEVISRLSPAAVVRKGVVHCPEGRRIFSRLTVRENLRLGYYTRRDAAEERNALERIYGLFPILRERQNQLGETLSGGEQQMLAIGRALMIRPELLLLDEPSLGLAPLVVEKIFETIESINKEGTAVLLVEQNAHLALQAAARAYVLENGRIVLTGSGSALLTDDRVRKAYLGEL